jgi:hypothetical protein
MPDATLIGGLPLPQSTRKSTSNSGRAAAILPIDMAIDFKPNFFSSPPPETQMLQIAFSNDPQFRARFGQWCYDNFDVLVEEYKKHGRFLTLAETEQILEE